MCTHALVQTALNFVPLELHPTLRNGDFREPTPWFDDRGWIAAAIWLAEYARPRLDPRDREFFEHFLGLAKKEVAAPWGNRRRRQTLREANARRVSRVPPKLAIWAGHEAIEDMALCGLVTRSAAAKLARFLLREDPLAVPPYLVALDALCVHLAAATEWRRRMCGEPFGAADTPWRGITTGHATHYLSRRPNGEVVLLAGYRGDRGWTWEHQVGPADSILACVPDHLFASAVEAFHAAPPLDSGRWPASVCA